MGPLLEPEDEPSARRRAERGQELFWASFHLFPYGPSCPPSRRGPKLMNIHKLGLVCAWFPRPADGARWPVGQGQQQKCWRGRGAPLKIGAAFPGSASSACCPVTTCIKFHRKGKGGGPLGCWTAAGLHGGQSCVPEPLAGRSPGQAAPSSAPFIKRSLR